jgi:DNA-binding response OmpR family regulator
MARILVVDDEQDLVWVLERSLAAEGHEVLSARDGVEGLTLARERRPDLVILDIVMPGLDGLEVCRRLRRDPSLAAVPILFLTVRGDIADRLKGWNEDCDDYVVKPFDMRELFAHIRALLRRTHGASLGQPAIQGRDSVMTVGSLSLDLHRRRAVVRGEMVDLTPIEFALLRFLMARSGQVISAEQLLQEVWGYDTTAGSLAVVRWHICNLRRKLELDPVHPVYIHTLPRHGYVLPAENPPQ